MARGLKTLSDWQIYLRIYLTKQTALYYDSCKCFSIFKKSQENKSVLSHIWETSHTEKLNYLQKKTITIA